MERWVIFQRRAEHGFHHFQHLTVIAVAACLCQRNIVFIQQQDNRLSVMRLHHPHERGNARFQHGVSRRTVHYIRKLFIDFSVVFANVGTGFQIGVFTVKSRNLSA